MNSTFLEPSDTVSHIVPEGRHFEIACHPPYGKPPPLMKWIKPTGDAIPVIGRVRVDGNKLVINKANAKTDTGRYTCRAENLAGSQQIFFDLTVAGEYCY